uniref:phosphatidyl-N-methylethanolamine N-methyltransferase n=1 Tax=Chromera velia CCMP2878 TaxID=1169474 RepID=A0A0G4FVB1_9ALVE|mmetsp:Transcript_49851/g.98251  ORF Transcript_49851/g.98251 Transcript_49851/m.98251 type:complete len:607 (-) Transcript_49851:132-1952(-)|eukprot:Cvel_18944.t1-p1 / transcript=Cvel_18944.t1 / gene=Cvel_18944 / organism=Chromera_velia_CCMP2878 / gene_product=hypothetical protein / transcript_product=hypothetical protein / location=Cvel_scaffold1600:30196-37074(+) / protein_length=606 / sequence_SO=supercontig / SO=protein_coding / is_pseudo=false
MGLPEFFESLAVDFRKYHRNTLNIALHLLTTPGGIAASLCLLKNQTSPEVIFATGAVYQLLIFAFMPSVTLWFATGLLTGLCVAFGAFVPMTQAQALWLLGGAVVGQELAHLITGEKTYMSTYIKESRWLSLLAEHTFLLLPLVLDSTFNMEGCFLNCMVNQNRTVFAKLDDQEERELRQTICDFVREKNPVKTSTTHHWFHALEGRVKEAFEGLAHSPKIFSAFRELYDEGAYEVEVVEGMNEIYVACEHFRGNSDQVFYMKHIDGPYAIFPFCSVYRAMLACNTNNQIETHFPGLPGMNVLSDGDIMGFDFNRELHYIDNSDKPNTDFRINLKLHYAVYPRCLKPLGKLCKWLTTRYDIGARNLFLYTIKPTTFFQRFMAWQVLSTTWLMAYTESFVGFQNILYFSLLGMAAFALKSYEVFLVGSSFLHYFLYIATYYQRKNVAYKLFLRDAALYKLLGIGQLVTLYAINFVKAPDLLSIALVAVGYGIAGSAYVALGHERTYFGSELGHHEPKWIRAFPYNMVPHPMIVGALIAMTGFWKLDALRDAFPVMYGVIPAHMLLYYAHMVQEMLNMWANTTTERLCSFKLRQGAELVERRRGKKAL